jgi:hypothetical protein
VGEGRLNHNIHHNNHTSHHHPLTNEHTQHAAWTDLVEVPMQLRRLDARELQHQARAVCVHLDGWMDGCMSMLGVGWGVGGDGVFYLLGRWNHQPPVAIRTNPKHVSASRYSN